MSRIRLTVAVAVVVVGIGFALLWDPTVCMSTAIGCPPSNPNCNLVYCSHEYVPLRVAVSLFAVVIGVLILTLRGKDRVVPGASQ